MSTVCPPLPPVSVSKMLQGPFRGLLTHLYSGTKSCSKLQRSFWLVMNGPLSDVSTHHAVISWLSHEVLWLTLWHILTVEWRLLHWLERGNPLAGLFSVSTWWLDCALTGGSCFKHSAVWQCHFNSPKTITRLITTTLTQHNRRYINNSTALYIFLLFPLSSEVFPLRRDLF